MDYTFFAISCYIVMRGLRVLLEDYRATAWYKRLMTGVAIVTVYAGVASLLVWYFEKLPLLGFSPGK